MLILLDKCNSGIIFYMLKFSIKMKLSKYIKILLALLTTYFGFGLLINAQTHSTFYLGHSLINFEIPQMVSELAKNAGTPMIYKANIGNGANLGWHWTQPHTGQGDRWDMTLNTQVFENFIITEAVPLKNHLQWSDTYGFLDKFYKFSIQKSPDVQLYIYETWHCINSGTSSGCEWDNDSHIAWRTRLDQDLMQWNTMIEEHNKKNQKKALMIPGGQGLAKLHDAIAAGEFPGFTSHRQLFSDDIHLTSIGNYFIACMMYAVLFNKSPEGLKNQLQNSFGQPFNPAPTPQQAQVLQKIAWETVCAFSSLTNVDCNTSHLTNQEFDPKMYFSYPYIHCPDCKDDTVQIFNILGQPVKNHIIGFPLNVSHFTPGVYFAKYKNGKSVTFAIP